MTIRDNVSTKVATSDVSLDESIYPRENIDHKRVSIFAQNLRDNFKLDQKIWRMNRLGIPQERIAMRLGETRDIIRNHLGKMLILTKSPNTDLSQGLTIPQVAARHGWTEPMLWSWVLEGKSDQSRFKDLGWGLRTWDLWNFNDCDHRFGDEWPGRIPAQMIAHILFYFSNPNNLIFDPMAGGGVTADTSLALGRRCWSLDMEDRPDLRPEIEPCFWDIRLKNWENHQACLNQF